MREIDAFITPILQRALLNKRRARKDKSALPTTSDDDATTLLDHLANFTDGKGAQKVAETFGLREMKLKTRSSSKVCVAAAESPNAY